MFDGRFWRERHFSAATLALRIHVNVASRKAWRYYADVWQPTPDLSAILQLQHLKLMMMRFA